MIFAKKIEAAYRGMIFVRCDDTGNVFYFDHTDFEGLRKENFDFKAAAGHTLKGAFYSYGGAKADRIVVFDHGMGGGHRSYMKEIERIARAGYLVFAYDHTGCMESGGESTNGFAQSLCDLNDCISALKACEKCAGRTFSVVGHSWGAFSTMNICALHPDITHIAALSGFISVEQMIKQNFSGLLSLYRKHIMAVERRANPRFADFNAIESLRGAKTKALLIYSADDPLVKKEFHYSPLREAACENVTLVEVENKGHNPNFTEDAVKYKDAFFAELTAKLKAGELETPEQKAAFRASYDWERMTAQDEKIWKMILEHLEK
ncbi:MAG: alpha/beta fold hydrolase [Clostridia bacterium]|nr:alpha/beta fold hydrolase [Clostridia bacterium]